MVDFVTVVDNNIKQNISKNTILDARLCVEELLINIVKHGIKNDSKCYIDIIVRVKSEKLYITIRDEGDIFDPIKYDKDSGLGLLLVNKKCKVINYSRCIGQNNTFLVF